MNKTDPDRDTLRHALDIEWQDHFQTRRQTWRTLEIVAILLLGFVAADLRLNSTWVTIVLGFLVILASLAGVSISLHHREAQVRKFTHIDRLEDALGLHRTGLLDDVHPPRSFTWADVLNPRRMNTPLFVLRMHLFIFIFVVVYMLARSFFV
ncbi:MAG: hypothetical protein JSW58_02030 [Candidatus Latescibacterota bacterium]|nr:MAG: hypothetical protein JSW58_02030 [Candidatus Latescibacterota bacterium]